MTRTRWPWLLLAVPAAPVLLVVLLVGGLSTLGPTALAATPVALGDIPARYLTGYADASVRCPGLAWTLLAAVGKVESDHGRTPGPSPAGAVGPMQFLPATWRDWRVDGNGDGRASPADPADAIPAAADYLCALGAADDPTGALVGYHCGATTARCRAVSAGYVAAVLGWAARYGTPTAGTVAPAAVLAVRTALAQRGTPYLWGGEGAGGFDCSGLAQFSYAAAGIALPRTAQLQYDAGPHLPMGVTPAAGDLVFFGADTAHVTHVGIALGDGRMVDAPHTGAVVRLDVIDASALVGITRPASAAPSTARRAHR